MKHIISLLFIFTPHVLKDRDGEREGRVAEVSRNWFIILYN